MAIAMVPLATLRLGTFAITNLFAFIVLALSAYTLSQASFASGFGFFFTYASLGVATAVLHLVSVTAMIMFGRMRDGALTSKVGVEILWLSFLWIMWIATGGETATIVGAIGFYGCLDSLCGASQAIAAFAFFNWLFLLGYVITLLTYAFRANQAGQSVWMADVKHVQWVQGPTNFGKPQEVSAQPTGATYPPGSGYPANVPPAVTPMHTGGQFTSPGAPQPQYYQQNGGTYQV